MRDAEDHTNRPVLELPLTRVNIAHLVVELRNQIADEEAAHAKTISNFEDHVEATAEELTNLRAQVAQGRGGVYTLTEKAHQALAAASVPHVAREEPIGTVDVLAEVAAERSRQDARWGEQSHPDGTGPRVVFAGRVYRMPEAANACRLACKAAAGEIPGLEHLGPLTWRHILLEEVFEALAEDDPATLRAELVQAAAVTVAWIEAIDRRQAATTAS